MIDITFGYINKKLEEFEERIQQYALGLQNVYDEFKKYELSKIDKRIEEMLTKIKDYELQKNVQEFDLDVATFPMNIRINLRIKTNFGKCNYSFDYPPALEYQLSHIIQGTYISMLNKLYDAHDARGGKYMGDAGCKIWMDENGETIVDMGEERMKR